jgi:hypothetical protein
MIIERATRDTGLWYSTLFFETRLMAASNEPESFTPTALIVNAVLGRVDSHGRADDHFGA